MLHTDPAILLSLLSALVKRLTNLIDSLYRLILYSLRSFTWRV